MSSTPEWMQRMAADEELRAQHPEWKPPANLVNGAAPPPPAFVAASAVPVEVSSDRERKNALEGLRREAAELATTGRGQRNGEANRRAHKMAAKYAAFGHLSGSEIYDAMMDACRANGHVQDDGMMAHNTVTGAIDSALSGGAYAPQIDWHAAPPPNVQEVAQINGHTAAWAPPVNGTNGNHTNGEAAGRFVTLTPLSSVVDDLPDWVWHAYGKGRIQLGTLVMLAGRPGAGKSTAARWFASQLTNGTLSGIWEGYPINVAYLAAEEQLDVLVKPSLRAVGADMNRIFAIAVEQDGNEAAFRSIQDEIALTQSLIAAGVRVVVVDPVMATLSGNVDINKNNEVRAHLEPYSRIATAINGIVICVAHLNKQAARDVVAGINGSSAFGEVPRAVFGFAKDDSSEDGDRIMSQSKNSAGAEDLALIYRLETTTVQTEKRGRVGEMAYFNIIGESQVNVEEVMSEIGGMHTRSSDCQMWLSDLLEQQGAMPYAEVLRAAMREKFSESTLQRVSRKLKVVKRAGSPTPDKPRTTIWEMPPSPAGRDFSAPEGGSDDE